MSTPSSPNSFLATWNIFSNWSQSLTSVFRKTAFAGATEAEEWFAVTLAAVEAAKTAREGDKEGKIIPIPKTAAA